MSSGKKKGYWDAIGYPVSTWIIYLILFSIAAAAGLYRFAAYFMSGTGLLLIAILFGLWAGARTSKVIDGSIGMGMLSGFMLGFIAGLVELLLILGTGTLVPGFGVAISGSTSILSILSIGIESWIMAVMASVLSAAIGSEFARR